MIEEERGEGVSLTARYEDLRAKAQRGEAAMEVVLLQQQGLPAWIGHWRRCAPAAGTAPAGPPEAGNAVALGSERDALVRLVVGMVLGYGQEGRQ